MRRFTALVLAMAMLAGIGTYPLLTAIACPMGKEMPANCPMRAAVKPVAPVPEVAAETPHSCCLKAKRAAQSVSRPKSAQRQMTGRCCCDMRSAPDRDDSAFVLPAGDFGIAVVAAPFVPSAPTFRAVSVSHTPLWKVDIPRGPPRALHSPRAPPLFS